MKKLALAVMAIAALAYYGYERGGLNLPFQLPSETQASSSDAVLAEAFDLHASNFQVEGQGVVKRILLDDNSGRRHQKFIVELASGQTLLIAHNIDLAPRVSPLKEGDRVQFYGEYEWNEKGGVIHWTHHDPDGQHIGGWIKSAGHSFQ